MAKWGNVYNCMVCDHWVSLCYSVSGYSPIRWCSERPSVWGRWRSRKTLTIWTARFPCDTAEYASRVRCCNEAQQKVLLEGLGSLPKQMHEKASRFWLVCALDRISARHWWRGWRWSQTLKKLMVLPHPLNVCSCFNPLCLLHTTLNTSKINLTCIIIVTTFLTQSFSAASAVQTDSSFGLKIAFLSLAYNWQVFIQLCNQ